MRRAAPAALALGVLAACRPAVVADTRETVPPPPPPMPTPPGEPPYTNYPDMLDLDLVETLFRYQFADRSVGVAPVVAYCVGVGRTRQTIADPPPELIRRLADVRPEVKPYSACSYGPIARDEASGGNAVIFHVFDIACAGADRCVARGGYYAANLGAAGSTYGLERVDGRWQVTSYVLNVVS